MKALIKIVFLFFLISIFSSCGGKEDRMEQPSLTGTEADDTSFTEEEKKELIAAHNQFALEVYSYLNTENSDQNVFFSPYSLFTAMSMAHERNSDPANVKVQSTFRVPEDNTARRAAIADIYNRLNEQKTEYQLLTANAVWLGEHLQPEGFNEIKKYYGAEVFVTTPIHEVNEWIAGKTNDIFKNAVNRMPSAGWFTLINTVYFKGDWDKKFDKAKTKDEPFIVSDTQTAQVLLMNMTGNFNYMETETMQLLEMPYKGEELSMWIFLPKDYAGKKDTEGENSGSADLAALEKELMEGNLSEWREALSLSGETKVKVYLPRFTFKKDYNLTETLRPYSHILIDEIKHKTFIDVNEEGTEAAAVTAVYYTSSMTQSAVPVFRADHPFIFLIQERETGQILFMGKFAKPTKNQEVS